MIKAYKLTDKNMQTCNKTQWVIGEWKETSGDGDLCGPGWLHYYSNATLAALLNPIHADFASPRLFEVEVAGNIKTDNGLKFGCTRMRLVQELQFVQPTTEQCVRFGILCALEVCKDAGFVQWANNWLDGTDRSKKTAWAAAGAAAGAAWAAGAAADAAKAAAARAARAAGAAAWAAARAAEAAAWAAEEAARAAEEAARAAAEAARAAAGGTLDLAAIDLAALAAKAMQ